MVGVSDEVDDTILGSVGAGSGCRVGVHRVTFRWASIEHTLYYCNTISNI